MFLNVTGGVQAHKISLGHFLGNHRVVGIRVEHDNSICKYIGCVCILEEIRIVSTIPT
jgi:hypothetical protein